MKEELLNAIKEDREMDFISSNGHQFTKHELITIVKEYMYALYECNKTGEYNIKELLEELEERL